ncbi:MAG TPA: histidine ammonia-lyase [Terriglobales bacterium]|nr:histidine ammonia-lyase [Terriglobales bacterium]
MQALHINGNTLTVDELREVVYERRPVLLEPEAREAVERAREVVEERVDDERPAYGVNTGVGRLADVRIPPEQIRELQVNLLRSHATGVGEPLTIAETRAMMLLRANSLAKGFSGVRPEVINTLCEMLNRGVHPVIPSQGSVGASGDLAPLAHLALVLIGEGEAVYLTTSKAKRARRAGESGEGARMPGGEAMRRAQVKTLALEAKEAISLINGTQAMLAVGLLALLAAETLADSADVIASLSLDALRGTDVAFDPRIHAARPHPGQQQVAENLRRMVEGSRIRESHRDCARVQDAYSLRCIPQVHGAVRDTLAFARQVFEIEMNAAVDNPLVFPPKKKVGAPKVDFEAGGQTAGEILSGGNFHGEPLAFALDYMAIALTSLGGISERRIERLVNPALNEGLPPFLAADAGLNSGLMMAQVTAAALASENKVLAHAASVDSITTSGNKEDYVSMGMAAALKLKRVLANTRAVLAIEAIAAAQGLEFLKPLLPSKRGQAAVAAIRSVSPVLDNDRVLAGEFAAVGELVKSGRLAALLE